MGARGTGVRRTRSWPAATLCLAALLALPAAAPAATTASMSASFAGTQHGAAIHFRFTLTESAGGVPGIATHAILHLPKGTGFSLPRLPKKDLCSPDALLASRNEPSVCPQPSHAGPVGSAELEAVIGGKPTIVKAPVRPYIIGLNGGLRELVLFLEGPPPFLTDALEVFPEKGGLGVPLESAEVALGVRSEMIGMSVTLGGSLKITPPASCPRGGYSWGADFTYSEGPPQSATTTSPCPGKSKAAAARRDTGYFTSPPWGYRRSPSVVAQAASRPTTPFQCEKRYHQAQSRESCFNQLPGANCSHPLLTEQSSETARGDRRDLKVTYSFESEYPTPLENAIVTQHYSWRPANKNVAICPYPTGVTYHVIASYSSRMANGSQRGPSHSVAYYHEHTTPNGGRFTYVLNISWDIKYGVLFVKGYYIPPPWEHRG